MSKKFWIIFSIILIVVAGFVVINNRSTDNGSFSGDPLQVAEDDHTAGSSDNRIVVIEYLDFQCPGCAGLSSQFDEAERKYGQKVTFVYRHFPLTSIHPNAIAAARASEAAAKQGKFSEIKQMLFTSQQQWSQQNTAQAQATFESYAEQLGLDMEQFKEDFASAETLNRINRDRESGNQLGVQSTPTVFINGEKAELDSENTLDKAIERAVLAAEGQQSDDNSDDN